MKILRAETTVVEVGLKAPFTIAFHTAHSVKLIVLQLITDGHHTGIGVASPFEPVTRESVDSCAATLKEDLPGWIEGRPFSHPKQLCCESRVRHGANPAARAAIDMALYDLWGKLYGRPVVELLGRINGPLPTSMTMGIRSIEESLEEAQQFVQMGYKILKVKGGADLEHDVELLTKLRERYNDNIVLRSDINQGYNAGKLKAFLNGTRTLNLEMIEQPFSISAMEEHYAFPEAVRKTFALDEGALNEEDALRLACEQPAGIINIKLMKCGGIHSAIRMATIAEVAGLQLLWGCMLESVAGLSAALHAALSCPNTRYLDLDGNYDLTEDVVEGGIRMENGILHPLDRPGLGITLKN